MARHPAASKVECEALEAFLTELFKPHHLYTLRVYASNDRGDDGDGFRISEIDISDSKGTGCSWMRCTLCVYTAALILAAEDFVRTFYVKPFRPIGWSDDWDEHGDAREKLRYMAAAARKGAEDARRKAMKTKE